MTPPPAVRGGTPVDAAVLFATARAGDGGAAALLPFADGTLVGRLAAQLATLGVSRTVVITRPAWEADVRAALGEDAEVVSSPDVVADLGLVAELAGAAGDRGLLLANGDIATHREALAGLLADPRMATGILGGGRLRPMVFRIRGRRGRVISAGSAYHAVHRPTATFLGLLKVTPGDGPALARAAEQLAPLCAEPPAAWLEELDRKAASWRVRLAAGDAADADADEVVESPDDEGEPLEEEQGGADVVLSPEDEARLRDRLATAPDDVVALLLVGLVRGGAHIWTSNLRRLYWSRPLSAASAAEAEREIAEIDEDRVLLDSAVKGADGFFTTFFVSTVLEVHRALVRAPRLHAEPGDHRLGADRAAGGDRVRHRRALGPGDGRGAALSRLRHRLRRRPARPLHAPVLQARRVAGLGVRPHQGVPRLRRPRDRREPDGRPRVAARVRGDHAADGAAHVRLLVRRLAARRDRPARRSRRSRRRPTPPARPSRRAAAAAARKSRRRGRSARCRSACSAPGTGSTARPACAGSRR